VRRKLYSKVVLKVAWRRKCEDYVHFKAGTLWGMWEYADLGMRIGVVMIAK
jgi:hypothetical protein